MAKLRLFRYDLSVEHAPDARTVTNYDVLKTLAVFLMIADHVGLYLYPDFEMLRVLGRLSLPIWFFLIGFARSRDVPFAWIFWMGVDLGLSAGLGLPVHPNMLLTLALVRLSLDALTPLLYPRSRFTIAFGVFALILMPLTQPILDYGSYAWPLAAIGLWARKDGTTGLGWMAAVLFGYFAVESLNFQLNDPQMLIFAGGLVCLLPLLACFNGDGRMRLSGWSAAIFKFFGAYSLVFYALFLIALKILWFFVH